MNSHSEFLEDTGICLTRVIGIVRRPEDSRKLLREACEHAETHGSSKLLFDLREAEVIASTMDSYEIVMDPEEQGFKAHYRIAAVYSGDMTEHLFMETVGVNRGYLFRVFDSLEQAVSWLDTGRE